MNFYSKLKENNLEKLDLKKYDEVIFVGTLLSRDNLNLASLIKDVKEPLIYISSIEDKFWQCTKLFIKSEIATEEIFLSLLAKNILENKKIPQGLKSFFEDLDDGSLSAESSVGEEEIEEILSLIDEKSCVFVLGEDLKYHPKLENIIKILYFLKKYADFDFALMDKLLTSYYPSVKNLNEIEMPHNFDGSIIYTCPFSLDEEEEALIGSRQFALALNLQDKNKILIKTKNNEYEKTFIIDEKLKGTVAVLPLKEETLEYRFQKVKIDILE